MHIRVYVYACVSICVSRVIHETSMCKRKVRPNDNKGRSLLNLYIILNDSPARCYLLAYLIPCFALYYFILRFLHAAQHKKTLCFHTPPPQANKRQGVVLIVFLFSLVLHLTLAIVLFLSVLWQKVDLSIWWLLWFVPHLHQQLFIFACEISTGYL